MGGSQAELFSACANRHLKENEEAHLPDVLGSKESCLSFVYSLGSDIFDHFGIILGLKTVSETCHGRFFGKMTSGAPRQR
jgi:hypothetical protein